MTAVAGILNKRGIAIAADSAVTMNRKNNNKIANSANKMLRLSSVNPISVMVTGNADFLLTPWDIVIRRFRQKRGEKPYPTVEACIEDFFSYILTEKMFISDDIGKQYLWYELSDLWGNVVAQVPELGFDEESHKVANTDAVLEAFRCSFTCENMSYTSFGKMPMFKDYSLEKFKTFLGNMIDEFLEENTIDEEEAYWNTEIYGEVPKKYTKKILNTIKDKFTECFYNALTNCVSKSIACLIFSGFGTKEEYPVLIGVRVRGGFDGRISYFIQQDEIYKISDENPVAICPFAQNDVMEALLTGIHPDFYKHVGKSVDDLFYNYVSRICDEVTDDRDTRRKLMCILESKRIRGLASQIMQQFNKRCEAEHKIWLKALRHYDLQSMARLAENLVAITGFDRHITFSQEGVGGPIDVAIITKNNGFTWLNRKSWYHHKDVGGRYGKFGV